MDEACFMISINSYRRVQDASDDYVEYEIQLKTDRREYESILKGRDTVIIYRRFNEFSYLYNTLKKVIKGAWPPFPKKSYFGRFNNEVLAERSVCFNQILQVIGADPRLQIHPDVKNFLNPEYHYEL